MLIFLCFSNKTHQASTPPAGRLAGGHVVGLTGVPKVWARLPPPQAKVKNSSSGLLEVFKVFGRSAESKTRTALLNYAVFVCLCERVCTHASPHVCSVRGSAGAAPHAGSHRLGKLEEQLQLQKQKCSHLGTSSTSRRNKRLKLNFFRWGGRRRCRVEAFASRTLLPSPVNIIP